MPALRKRRRAWAAATPPEPPSVSGLTATFGQGTPAGAAGWRPYTSAGAVDPLVSYDSLVSGSLGAYTPSISSGRLVFTGTTGAPNGAVLRCTGSSGAIYDVTISSPANTRAVKDQTEFDALTSSVYSVASSKLVIREGAGIDWNHFSSGWSKRVNLNGLVIEGEGPDPRTTWQDSAHDARRHVRYIEADVLNNVVVQNCLIATNVGLSGDTKRDSFWARSSSGGGVDTDHIVLRRNAIVNSRPNPNGNYSGGAGTYPGSRGIRTELAKGIEVRDNVIHGTTYAVMPYVSTWQLIVGNWIDCWYGDAIQAASIASRSPVHIYGNHFTRPCALATDAGNPHTDAFQDEGDGNTGVGVWSSAIEGNVVHRGSARGFVQSFFVDDVTGSPRFTSLMRGNISTESQTPGNMFQITSSDGSIMDENTFMHIVGTPSPAGAGRSISSIGHTNGTSYFRNNLYNATATTLTSIVTSGNVDVGALSEAARTAAFTDRTFGGVALPTMKQVIDGAVGIGVAAGKGSKMALAAGAERSAYTYPGLSAPVFAEVSVTRVTDTSATLSLKSTVECNPIYWAAIPSATATPTDIEDIRRRRITGAHSYGILNAPAGATATAKTAALTVPSAASYKVVYFQENGWTVNSGIVSTAFSTVLGGSSPNELTLNGPDLTLNGSVLTLN